MTRHYEIIDGNLHVGWASEDYVFTKMDERILKGEANFDFHIGDRDAIDVEPVKHGHWEVNPHDRAYDVCSACGIGSKRREYGNQDGSEYVTEWSWKYCPNCGAKMDETCN